jgi:hypothetical protein
MTTYFLIINISIVLIYIIYFFISLFLILSNLVHPMSLRKKIIYAARILMLILFLLIQSSLDTIHVRDWDFPSLSTFSILSLS